MLDAKVALSDLQMANLSSEAMTIERGSEQGQVRMSAIICMCICVGICGVFK